MSVQIGEEHLDVEVSAIRNDSGESAGPLLSMRNVTATEFISSSEQAASAAQQGGDGVRAGRREEALLTSE
jgi:hypothetical protein